MTTLRRALPRLFKGESIPALVAMVCTALLLAVTPAMASTHGGGGGGGGHMGGGGHSGGGFHGGTAHPVGPGGHFAGPFHSPGHGFFPGHGFPGHGFFPGRGFYGGPFIGFGGFGLGFGLGLGLGWDYPWGWWGPGYPGWDYPYYYPGYYSGGYGYYGDNGGYYGDDDQPGQSGAQANPPPGGSQRGMPAPQAERQPMGALNLDISPADAEVYLNGQLIGRVRDFGRWSRGYLWLEKGTYDIVFYKDGYKTLARQVTIYPGLVITWDDKMEHGQAVRPEDLPSKTHERRNARIQFEQDRAEQIDRQQAQGGYYGQPAPPPPAAPQANDDNGGWSDNWHDRVTQDRGGNPGAPPAPIVQQRYVRPMPAPQAGPDRFGRLHLRVEPGDASVYLDGRFVGTGADLDGRDEGLVLSPGRHKLAVVRPGRQAEERDFDAMLGRDVDLNVALAPAGR